MHIVDSSSFLLARCKAVVLHPCMLVISNYPRTPHFHNCLYLNQPLPLLQMHLRCVQICITRPRVQPTICIQQWLCEGPDKGAEHAYAEAKRRPDDTFGGVRVEGTKIRKTHEVAEGMYCHSCCQMAGAQKDEGCEPAKYRREGKLERHLCRISS